MILFAALTLALAPAVGGNGVIIFLSGADPGEDPALWSNVTVLVDQDVVTVGVGGVSEWANAGTEADFTQATSTKRPQDGSRGITPDSVDDTMAAGSNPMPGNFVTTTAYTVLLVCNPWEVDTAFTANNRYKNDAAMADAASLWGVHFSTASGGSVALFHYGSGFNYVEAAAAVPDDADIVLGAYYDGSELGIRVNDGSWATASTSQPLHAATGALQLWDSAIASVVGGVAIRDAVIASDAKTPTEIEAAMQFLKVKRSVSY